MFEIACRAKDISEIKPLIMNGKKALNIMQSMHLSQKFRPPVIVSYEKKQIGLENIGQTVLERNRENNLVQAKLIETNSNHSTQNDKLPDEASNGYVNQV